MKPKMLPITTAIRIAVIILPPRLIIITAMIYSATVAVAGNDISMPPLIRTKSTPMAIIPKNELLFSRSNMFSAVRKFGFRDVIKAERIIIMITRYVS